MHCLHEHLSVNTCFLIEALIVISNCSANDHFKLPHCGDSYLTDHKRQSVYLFMP